MYSPLSPPSRLADELGILEENDLYCQFQPDESNKPAIVTGKVVICPAPALHLGDIRHAYAVDRPELRHLKNVIVFSTKGTRLLPNMPLKVSEPTEYMAPPPIRVDKVTQGHLNESRGSYESDKVLGRIFRLIDAKPSFTPSDLRELGYPVSHRLERFPTCPKLLDKLRPMKEIFENAVVYTLKR
ncbi:hypothetical protein Q5752_003188 [Cryptotrichosporon argae]